ncbi:hypothetical protein HYPSUDRAFT_41817 [Hypholoma sublateritium FD-334 SS-4]|uniref:Cytochrome P450 n=1 Tax=Hypholoma sublateritium (strain FD-334 SS-4) TaxID=945553 RepID=A0A0D2L4F6_HYPSF|nr:hypothetical protein HYPSUDRAFT_41817 [Hypholoma sublateritium FD-334 SS-4]
MSIMYAYDVTTKDDYLIELAEKQSALLAFAVYPGVSLLHVFPVLRFLPAWFPGAGFKRHALKCRKIALEICDVPIDIVQKQINDGTAAKCVTVEFLETCQSKDGLAAITGAAASAYGAGADTTAASIKIFFQAMAMYPEVQCKAQKEIDAYIGSERLVSFDDRSSLPYVEALFREVMQWRPVAPLSFSHANSSDDTYKGCFIPKGTTIITNIWAMAHNPEKYLNPDVFNPDRFFNEKGQLNDDDVYYIFGFGRRICPGRHVASTTVWLAIVNVLQSFDIQKKRDSSGNEIPVDGGYTDGLTMYVPSLHTA